MTHENSSNTIRLGFLLDKKFNNKPITPDEDIEIKNLVEEETKFLTDDDKELLQRAAKLTAGTALTMASRAKLLKCQLTEDEINLFDHGRKLLSEGHALTSEQEHDFKRVRTLVNQCWGNGRKEDPDTGNGPHDSGPSITDALGVQPIEDDDETKPTTTLPGEEPAPVQIPVPVKPEDEKKKAKPRTPVPGKKGGVDFR